MKSIGTFCGISVFSLITRDMQPVEPHLPCWCVRRDFLALLKPNVQGDIVHVAQIGLIGHERIVDSVVLVFHSHSE